MKSLHSLVVMLVMCLLATPTLLAERFSVNLQRFTNHAFSNLIRSHLPIITGGKKVDGVLGSVVDNDMNADPPDAILVTLRYKKTDGKSYVRKQYAFLDAAGCSPEPCRWAPVVFVIGADFEPDSLRATVETISWVSVEEEN